MSSQRGRRMARLVVVVVGTGLLLGFSGCAHRPPPIKPWQREALAKRGMRLDMSDELQEDRFRQHWFGSREGSDLGYGQPGGGCGCN